MQALSGIRVIDLSQWRTGAQLTQVMSDFGAEVVWIEPPGGSRLRQDGAFPFYGRGKQSLVADLHDPTGVATVLDLASGADVLVETFRPGVADRLGLGYEQLQAVNPRLVHVSITGFGSRSPYASVRAYEGIVQAKLGVFQAFEKMSDAGRPPYLATPWCSFPASQLALHGALTALLEREKSGLGQHVETSLAQGYASLDTWEWFTDLITQRHPEAFKPAQAWSEGVPLSPVVFMLLVGITKDGHWLQFAQVAPRLFVAMMKALELDWMFTDPDWKGLPLLEDPARRRELIDRMQAAVGGKTLAEWEEIFAKDPNVFAEVYRAGPEVLDHPQLQATGQVVTVVDPAAGPVRQPAPLSSFEGVEAEPPRPAPRLDEHDETLAARWQQPDAGEGSGARTSAAPRLPLEGVTVVELAVQFAAPFGATLLTDLGARVIKVESLEGDPIRTISGFPEAGGAKVMQGKDSICVDISTPEGAAIVRELASRADVFLDGFRPGASDRHGLGASELRAANPRLVHVSASGYGPGGPYSERPAFAPSIGAASGVARANIGDSVRALPGLEADEIRHSSIRLFTASATTRAQADGFAALGVATCLLLGLLARERSGDGQTVSSSMLLTAAHAMAEQVVDGGSGRPAGTPDLEMRGPGALYRIYDASDGWVFLAVGSDDEWDALTAALPAVEELRDERFSTAALRRRNDADLVAVLAAVFEKRTKAAWESDLLAAGVACVEVTTEACERVIQGDALSGPDSYVAEVEHPTFDKHLRLGPCVRFSRSATQAKPGVLAGSHTAAILAELGYDAEAIEDLRKRSIVG